MNGVKNDEFIEANLGLVRLCANRFRGKGIEYDDLYGAGCIGLVKAAKAFDETRGARFSTYAVPVILGEIKRLFRDGGTVKVSRPLKELSLKVTRERESFSKSAGREPTVSELSKILGVSPEEVAEATAVSLPPLSLTPSDPDDERSGQIDIPVDAPDILITDLISLRQVMNRLSDEDRQLIVLRYFRKMTQTQAAELLGTTQVQISRREKKILTRLREMLLG
ncbi:MAG: sigma-70 family RNA polymerase sigma factor [Oscillospiraceae bacterium]|nr:sigma-70 family RNA polymerase sigma factor [Oscillospiraceae bacterium]